jgi:hypothetical protein
MPPPIQPSSPPPAVITSGKRSIRVSTSLLPQTTIGIETTMPNDDQNDRAVRRTGDRDDVVYAHYGVGDDDRLDCSGQRGAALHIAVCVLVFPAAPA